MFIIKEELRSWRGQNCSTVVQERHTISEYAIPVVSWIFLKCVIFEPKKLHANRLQHNASIFPTLGGTRNNLKKEKIVVYLDISLSHQKIQLQELGCDPQPLISVGQGEATVLRVHYRAQNVVSAS